MGRKVPPHSYRNTNLSSSAPTKIGAPPEKRSPPPHLRSFVYRRATRRTLAEPLWLGTGSLQCDGRAVHLAGSQLLCSPQSWSCRPTLDGHGHMLIRAQALEGFDVCRPTVNYDQPSASHFNLLKIRVSVFVNAR
jgi:hypothetical protein